MKTYFEKVSVKDELPKEGVFVVALLNTNEFVTACYHTIGWSDINSKMILQSADIVKKYVTHYLKEVFIPDSEKTLTYSEIEKILDEGVINRAELLARFRVAMEINTLEKVIEFQKPDLEEKDWKIVEWWNTKDQTSFDESFFASYNIDNPDHKIHSVIYKGEIFTVGDKTEFGKIEQFKIEDKNHLNCYFDRPLDKDWEGGCVRIDFVKKLKPTMESKQHFESLEEIIIFLRKSTCENSYVLATSEMKNLIDKLQETQKHFTLTPLPNKEIKPDIDWSKFSDEEIEKVAAAEILYNTDKRNWVTIGMKEMRDKIIAELNK